MENQLKSLSRKRGNVKHKLTCFTKYIDTIETLFNGENKLDGRSILELQSRTQAFENLLLEFDEMQNEIEMICEEDDLENQYKERSDFTDKFNMHLASAIYILQCSGNSSQDDHDNSVSPSRCSFSENSKIHSNTKRRCNFCESVSHTIYRCDSFLALSVPLRREKVISLGLCPNCLCTHDKQCRLGPCKICHKPHSSLLHDDNQVLKNSDSDASTKNNQIISNQEQKQGNNDTTLNFSSQVNNFILLATAVVGGYDFKGSPHYARMILDSGSQSCFVSERLCRQLGLKTSKVNTSVLGLNNVASSLSMKCELSIHSLQNEFKTKISCYVLPKITDNLPTIAINVNSWKIPDDLPLADPHFYQSDSIDLLIGANLFYNILRDGRILLGKQMPVLQNTVFGYIVSGEVPFSVPKEHSFFVTHQRLHEDLQRFWAVDEIKGISSLTDDELQCETHFVENVSRDKDGKFIVKIPLKEPISCLGDSKSSSLKRFHNLERRFQRDDHFKTQYISFMNEYFKLGHMVPVDSNESNISYYLPHHGVLKKESLTTKLRVVFDGSAVTTSGKSLNDIQLVGPPIQNSIFDVLIRFRRHEVVVTSDIEKMYRCIWVHPEDRHLQQIFWRSSSDQSIKVYELATVTYGTASAPYLAIRCLRQLAKDNKNQFPQSCEIIFDDFYVDDLITSFKTENAAIKRCQEISSILKTAGFRLRKWRSNSPKVLNHLKDDSDELSVLNLSDYDTTKTLGIQWNCTTDSLSFQLTEPADPPTNKISCLA